METVEVETLEELKLKRFFLKDLLFGFRYGGCIKLMPGGQVVNVSMAEEDKETFEALEAAYRETCEKIKERLA